MKKTHSTLLQTLRQFGLNPKDWTLIPKSDPGKRHQALFEIQHKNDPNLRFLGQAQLSPVDPTEGESFYCWREIGWSEAA